MPARIHNTNEAARPIDAAFPPSPSPITSTISCDSIKTIEAWLDNVEAPKVTVIVEDSDKAGPDLAQEPGTKNTRKRKHSSSLAEEKAVPVDTWKQSRHLPQSTLGNEISVAPPITGNASRSVQTSTTPHKSSASDVPSSPSATPKIPYDFGSESERMKMHGLLYDPKALEKYPEFHDMVLEIVNGERYSAMKQKSIDRVKTYSHFTEYANEATFLGSLLPLLIKEDRTVKLEQKELGRTPLELAGNGDGVMQDPQPGPVYGSRDWWDDGVFAVSLQEFREDLLPHRYLADDPLAQMRKKADGMLTPKPRRCYGLLQRFLPIPCGVILDDEIRYLIGVCPPLSHPFFLLEGISNNGSLIEAQNRVRRGGASLVNAMRLLLAKIGELPVIDNGVDDRNFVFSATLMPGLMNISVHWVEMKNGSPRFHMNLLKPLAIGDREKIAESRKILNNIMSWGCDLDKRGLNELREKIYAWQRQETAKSQERDHSSES